MVVGVKEKAVQLVQTSRSRMGQQLAAVFHILLSKQ